MQRFSQKPTCNLLSVDSVSSILNLYDILMVISKKYRAYKKKKTVVWSSKSCALVTIKIDSKIYWFVSPFSREKLAICVSLMRVLHRQHALTCRGNLCRFSFRIFAWWGCASVDRFRLRRRRCERRSTGDGWSSQSRRRGMM